VHDPDLVPLLGVPWSEFDHRSSRSRLERLGWTLCGQGDWAYAYRSPSGRLVGRVSPFEPGYAYFTGLCERCPGNRHVPRIELATRLEGGGHLTVLEYLHTADSGLVETFLWQWDHPDQADADLRVLRHEVDSIDAWGRRNVRWWIGIDIGERHVRLSSDGNLKVIDLFGVGWGLLDDLVNDPAAFARRLPPEQRRYILDIPDLQADDHPADYIRRIREAVAAANACDR
jgi:hypothetical protein